MPNKKRVLFVSGEIAPYVRITEVATLARQLPEKMSEAGLCEPRIMMPRYGKISERKNRLHEVIRLSGTPIQIGKETETLKVKVASIPGIRLQVYFMDNNRFFKKKVIYTDANGKPLTDNITRALFFGKAVLETLKKLGWAPDVVHAFTWMSGFIPYLLRTEYAQEPIFDQTKIVFTPDNTDVPVALTEEDLQKLALTAQDRLFNKHLNEVGHLFADITASLPEATITSEDILLNPENEELVEQLDTLYNQLLYKSRLVA